VGGASLWLDFSQPGFWKIVRTKRTMSTKSPAEAGPDRRRWVTEPIQDAVGLEWSPAQPLPLRHAPLPGLGTGGQWCDSQVVKDVLPKAPRRHPASHKDCRERHSAKTQTVIADVPLLLGVTGASC
jgi:hypothetical protein